MHLKDKRGFILLLTLVFLATLTVIVSGILYMISVETRDIGAGTADKQLLYLADAGIERAVREIGDEVASAPTTGTADLRGADTTGSVSVSNVDRIRYVEDGNATINNDDDRALIRTFDSNYASTKIVSVFLGVRADRASGGTGATIEVSYTTNGVLPEAGNTVLTQALTTSLNEYYQEITSDRTWTWDTIMSSDFIVQARRISGNRNINLDTLFLRVTYQIDTLNEDWATGNYETFPMALGSGTIQSISITDESARLHLNYASQALLTNLLQNLGISSASTKAAAIVNYRGAALTNPFESVEELQEVTGITTSDYNTLKDYLTVYSFVNTAVYRPTGPRAPVNINTAPFEVLKAVFDSSSLGGSDSTSLANDIIASRPFVGFYSVDSSSDTYFYNFAQSRSYLSGSGNPDERDRVLDTADGSSLIPVSGSNGYNCPTTELCYATDAFRINALADIGGRSYRIITLRSVDGARTFTRYIGDAAPSGYRAEGYE